MKTTYGLADLFALVAKVLAPFVDPLRAEFARNPAPVYPPIPEPAPAQVSEVVPAPNAAAEEGPAAEPVVIFARVPVELPAVPVADAPASPPESEPAVYVRKPAGKKWRYIVATPNARGTLFRKSLKGRRTTYEPCR